MTISYAWTYLLVTDRRSFQYPKIILGEHEVEPNGRVAADGSPGPTDHGRVITVGVLVTVFLRRFQRFVNKNVSPHQGINFLFTITTLVLSFYICNINLFCRDYNNRNIIKVFIDNYLPLKSIRVEIQQ